MCITMSLYTVSISPHQELDLLITSSLKNDIIPILVKIYFL